MVDVTQLHAELVHRPLEEVGVVLEGRLGDLGQAELRQQAGPSWSMVAGADWMAMSARSSGGVPRE